MKVNKVLQEGVEELLKCSPWMHKSTLNPLPASSHPLGTAVVKTWKKI